MKNKKSLIIALAAFVLVVAVAVTVYFVTRPEATDGVKTFTVTVTHANGTSKGFNLSTDAEFLGDYLVDRGIIEIGGADEGMFNYADGEAAIYEVDQTYWGFYVNGEYATTGIFDTPIEDGVHYELRHEDGSSW